MDILVTVLFVKTLMNAKPIHVTPMLLVVMPWDHSPAHAKMDFKVMVNFAQTKKSAWTHHKITVISMHYVKIIFLGHIHVSVMMDILVMVLVVKISMNANLIHVIQMLLAVILQGHLNAFVKMDFMEMAHIVTTKKSAMSHQKMIVTSMPTVKTSYQACIHVSVEMDTMEMVPVVRILMNVKPILVIQMPLVITLRDHSYVHVTVDLQEMAHLAQMKKSAISHQEITAISMLIVKMTSLACIPVNVEKDILEMALVVKI